MSGILIGGTLWAVMACRAGMPYNLCRTMVAVTAVESSGCKNLIGDDGASLGCDQVSIKAAKALGVKVTRLQLLNNAPLNMEIAAAYMARCIVRMGTWERGLVCYNAGEKIAIKLSWREIQRFPYVRKVKKELPAPISPVVSLELVEKRLVARPYRTIQSNLGAGTLGHVPLKPYQVRWHSQMPRGLGGLD
jgi:Transglycosylase SLT domain